MITGINWLAHGNTLLRRLDPKVGGHRGVCCMQRQEMVICLMMVAMVGGAAAQDDCTGAQHP